VNKTKGWVEYSIADQVFYLMMSGHSFRLLVFGLSDLQTVYCKYLENKTLYKEAFGENVGYRTHGILVPISDIPDVIIFEGQIGKDN
jgi:hypothetical protein